MCSTGFAQTVENGFGSGGVVETFLVEEREIDESVLCQRLTDFSRINRILSYLLCKAALSFRRRRSLSASSRGSGLTLTAASTIGKRKLNPECLAQRRNINTKYELSLLPDVDDSVLMFLLRLYSQHNNNYNEKQR